MAGVDKDTPRRPVIDKDDIINLSINKTVEIKILWKYKQRTKMIRYS